MQEWSFFISIYSTGVLNLQLSSILIKSKPHLHRVCTSAVTSILHTLFSSQVLSSASWFLLTNCLISSHHLLSFCSVKLGHFLVYAKISNGINMLITSQSYLLIGFFVSTSSFNFGHIKASIFFKGPNNNISTFILWFYFHQGEERDFPQPSCLPRAQGLFHL